MINTIRSILAPWYHLYKRSPLYAHYFSLVHLSSPLEAQIATLPLTPFPKVYWVDLDQIQFNGYIEQCRQGGRFCSGSAWPFPKKNKRTSIFENIPPNTYRYDIHETIRMIFIEGHHYTETPEYMRIRKVMKKNPGRAVWGCKNEAEVEQLFEGRRKAFASIKKYGYMTQKQLGKYNYDEISVYLTENGEILKGIGGNHRILLAELAGIQRLPVVIRGVHSQFARNIASQTHKHPLAAINEFINDDQRFHESME